MSKYNVDPSYANHLGSALNLALALTSPPAGLLVDRIGYSLYFINDSLLSAVFSQLILGFVTCHPYIPLVIYLF